MLFSRHIVDILFIRKVGETIVFSDKCVIFAS